MNKMKKLYILLGVLVVLCIACFAVTRIEVKKENIKTEGVEVLAIDVDKVEKISIVNESGTFVMTKSGDSWKLKGDDDFPVGTETVTQMLKVFRKFNSTFTISDAKDLAQYGLKKPICTITLEESGKTHTISLGDFSVLDNKRYVSVDDGKVYLAAEDPAELWNVPQYMLVDASYIPDIKDVSKVSVKGLYNYTVERNADKHECSDKTCELYSNMGPVDQDRLDIFLGEIKEITLNKFVNYTADKSLAEYGLDKPEVDISVDYEAYGKPATFSYQLASYHTEKTTGAYIRINNSPLIYELSEEDYEKAVNCSYNKLRYWEIFIADSNDITRADIELDGKKYALVSQTEGKNKKWFIEGKEGGDPIDIKDFTDQVEFTFVKDIKDFTNDKKSDKAEIKINYTLDDENCPKYSIEIYRYDGSQCLAYIDGKPFAYIYRGDVVKIVEAVNALVL